MLEFSIYLLYRAGMAIASALPLRVLFAIGNFIGLIGWLLLPQYRRLARRNPGGGQVDRAAIEDRAGLGLKDVEAHVGLVVLGLPHLSQG